MNSSQNIFSLVLGEVASQDSNHLSQKSALIVGAGSLGVAVSDILVKLKIGKLILFDYDREEIAREEVTRKRRSFFSTNQHESCLRMMSSRLTALVTKLKWVFNGHILYYFI
jgi:tRNA A37 threonylcarbamoyladenosine dehydratase